MTALALRARYPCCGGAARLVATVEVPMERYDRRCPRCGQDWTIERRLLIVRPALRADRLDWRAFGAEYGAG